MKAISFLGIQNYKVTTYYMGDREMTTSFFAEALPVFYPELERILVFVTPTVEKHRNLEVLKQRLGDKLQPVPIPEGHSEEDLWRIFTTLTEAVAEGEQVVFDITNSFRSLPFLTFLAAAYLRRARNVRVVSVVYGAFEAGGENQRSPVFNLTPFVSLLDWLTATDQFIQTGDARRLAGLLNPDGLARGPAAEAAQALSTVSLAAFLCQPFQLMAEAKTLDERLRRAEQAMASVPAPYTLLRNRIVATFGSFSAEFDPQHPEATLAAQKQMIEWYYANNQLIQAMTLAREWLISMVTYRLGLPLNLSLAARQRMEAVVNQLVLTAREDADRETEEPTDPAEALLSQHVQTIYEQWPECGDLIALWNNLRAVRNALAHAEHQKDAMKLRKITVKAEKEIMPGLRRLAAQWLPAPSDRASPAIALTDGQ